jgi:hypothetical protein
MVPLYYIKTIKFSQFLAQLLSNLKHQSLHKEHLIYDNKNLSFQIRKDHKNPTNKICENFLF